MDWTAMSAISETIGLIALLATLIYVAVQTRQNADAIRANTRHEILASDQALLQRFSEDPDLEQFRYKPDLTTSDRIRIGFLFLTFARIRENNWFQYRSGVLDDLTWRSYKASIAVMFGAPNGKTWWESYSSIPGIFDPAFISLVNELLSQTPAITKSRMITAFD
jgi:hypothetical protein